MNRTIKFRAWDEERKQMWSWELVQANIRATGQLPFTRDDLVLMQFTGLHDKNGKEIYEGDIIEGLHDFGPGGFHVKRAGVHWDIEMGYQWQYWRIGELEILGNIYENGELLKQDEK